jgi:hypothetical protein
MYVQLLLLRCVQCEYCTRVEACSTAACVRVRVDVCVCGEKWHVLQVLAVARVLLSGNSDPYSVAYNSAANVRAVVLLLLCAANIKQKNGAKKNLQRSCSLLPVLLLLLLLLLRLLVVAGVRYV